MRKNLKISLITVFAMLLALCLFLSITGYAVKAETSYTTETFKLVDGAYMRPYTPKGIRFEAGISENEKNGLPEGSTFGMLITLDSYLNGNELTHNANINVVDIPTKIWLSTSPSKLGSDYVGYYSTMVGGSEGNSADMESEYYSSIFVARGYINIGGEYIYTQNTVARSIAGVAEMTVETADEQTDLELLSYAQEIVDNSKKINFNMDSQNGQEIIEKQVVVGSILNQNDIPEEPIKENYVFTGWYKDADCTQKFEFSGILKENTTIYAGWLAQTNAQYFTYSENTDGTLTINDYTGADTDVVIPSEIDGKLVTRISYAFEYCVNLKSIVIPSSVISIGEMAFYNCSSLESIEIPNSVTSLGSLVFKNCDSLTNITIPSSITSIGEGVFNDCSNLEIVTFEENSKLTSIGQEAFYNCSKLKAVSFCKNSKLTNMGDKVFYGCKDLISVILPESITSIGWEAFYNCSSLESIEIPSSVTSINSEAFYNCMLLKSIKIPNGVKSIGKQAFYNCDGLESIEIPNNVTSIGISAFEDCKNLKTVTFGENSKLTSIGTYAFKYCSSLESIEIPSSVTSIGSGAFNNCSSLESIEIPSNVTSIDGVFSNCSSLKYNEYENGLYLGNSENKYLVLVKAKDTTITSCEINSNTKFIYSNAFKGCSSLGSIEIPSSVTSIGYRAFYECSSLESVVFEQPNGWVAGTTAISNSDLADSEVAATYLTETYSTSEWKRS